MEGGDERSATSGEKVVAQIGRRYQHLLDRSTVYTKARWGAAALLIFLYSWRVYLLQGWYIVSYGLGIFLLNTAIGFVSPQIDPDAVEGGGPVLPTAGKGGEFRPFTRRVPEFKAWHSTVKAVLASIVMTFFSFFDIPVFWPILLVYFVLLLFMTTRRQIAHMIKHRYVPWSSGKTRYDRKDPVNAPGASKGGGMSL